MIQLDNRWYIVLAPWGNSPLRRHVGLGGEAWPLDPIGAQETAGGESCSWRMVWLEGCSFEICVDEAFARSYYDIARDYVSRLRLIEVRDLSEDGSACHGIDVGWPSGGFSAAAEICASASLIGRCGKYLNADGLFASAEALEEYMAAREGREKVDGVEYLDESCPMWIRVIAEQGSGAT